MNVATRELDALVRREHANPHAVLGAHPDDGGVVVRALPPGGREGRPRVADGDAASSSKQVAPRRRLRGPRRGRGAAARATELEVDYGDGGSVHDRGPVPVRADDRRARPAPGRRGAPRGALGAPRRARDRARGRARAPRSRSGRRPRARSAWSATSTTGTGACTRCARSGSTGIWELFLPGVGDRAPATSTRSSAPTASSRLKADPLRVRRPSCRRRPPRSSASPRTSGRDDDVAGAARRKAEPLGRPMSIYEVHLGSWRLNPLEGNRSLSYLELADELAAYAQGHGLHPRRAAAGDGAPVQRARGATR